MKSYLVLMFVTCFLFSFAGEAKILTAKEVAAAKKQKNKQVKAPRKVVRLDFDQPEKAKKEIKPVAKAEPPKKMFKSIECHNGFIVGQKAYCASRSVASVPKSGKKLKPSKKF